MALEVWRPIPGYPDYEVSDQGRVMRVTRSKTRSAAPRLISGYTRKNGYRVVTLTKREGDAKLELIHRLVLLAFVGRPPSGLPFGCHNDGNPSNNHLSNLRWDSQAGNQADRKRHGTHNAGDKSPMAKLDWEKVEEIRSSITGKWGEQSELARKFGVSRQQIHHIAHQKNWTAPWP